MSSSNLKWVYGPTHRAQDVSNEAVDEYKSIVRQLYLDQNRTREEVLSHLRDAHGFSLSTNQFSKATKRWGFYKQPRQVKPDVQPPESIDEEVGPYPLIPLDELLYFEPDVLDTTDETEACFEADGENCADLRILEAVEGHFPSTRRHVVSEPPPSINDWGSEAIGVDFPCEALPFGLESFKSHLHQLNTARKLQKGPHSISSKMTNLIPYNDHINKSRVDYFVCCYLFQEAVDCLGKFEKSVDKRERQVTRSDMDKLFAQYYRDEDKLLATPNESLDMWSILYLLEARQLVIPDDLLLDRLDTNDLQFMTVVKACLELCEEWIELVRKGLPKVAFQFDSLCLHQTAGKAVHNLCHPLYEQGRFDIWLEAGYLFAFIWSNEQRKAASYWCWLREAEISGLSPTYFLAIICQMIVYVTAVSYPNIWRIVCEGDAAAKIICAVYLQSIDYMKSCESRSFKRLFIYFFFNHHTRSDLDPEERKALESVQSYQRRAADFAYKEEPDILTQKVNSALYSESYSYVHQQYLSLLKGNPTMTRSLASGSSRGSSLNSFRAFQAASRAMETCLKKD
ncbi:hypothetical protein FVEG_17253 [Fusarium verticillioides 7600]|uniref:Clr5 domain-containing protein n=1 Tax=Gibberella moniliformis (strain M3125 / FGSC 7600) TaxID=334819 RepID=W7MSQ7_GIBM7|nr:hypothetical protein FVEG_17253 [Fusarium verticillioides 7600]EWG54141.1 hypothetical protein FVEG_17253 [Fusarium verticillioides 7600]